MDRIDKCTLNKIFTPLLLLWDWKEELDKEADAFKSSLFADDVECRIKKTISTFSTKLFRLMLQVSAITSTSTYISR